MELNSIYHLDFLSNSLPSKSVQLIIADPPYFQVKGEFDFIWSDFEAYLKDVELWARECDRLLADNGALFWWGHAKKIAYSQVVLDNYFHLENAPIWEKTNCQTKRNARDQARSFPPITERLLFYSRGPEKTPAQLVEREFIAARNPFAIELKRARQAAGLSVTKVAEKGKFYKNVNRGGMVSNWENGYNNPLAEQWATLCSYLPIEKKYADLLTDYQALKDQFKNELVAYEKKRRPFFLKPGASDVFKYSQESNISKMYDHETIKPEKLTRFLIQSTTRPGDLVLAPFAGSGTECAMAARLGRSFIGFEKIERFAISARERTQKELKQYQQNPTLFSDFVNPTKRNSQLSINI